MSAPVARALLSLAAACLGERRREWAMAMRGELEAAVEQGRPLAFAAGCVIAAWREMPNHREGRFALANNALALGLLVPMAGLQIAWAAGFYGGPVPGSVEDLYLCDAFMGAVPSLLGLSLFLCLLQLRFAWLLLEGDWLRVAAVGSLIAAATATLAIFTGLLFLDGRVAVLHAAALAIDIAASFVSARWRGRVFPTVPAQRPC
jgi:hypothetical protein